MNAKTTMVLIALIGIGLFVLPQTTALFAGQHSFTNIDATGNQIECVKCHGDVQAELGSSNSTITGTPGAHAAFKCEFCHRIEAGSSSGDNAYSELSYKNATVTADGTAVYRKIVVTIMDMEAKNIPINMTPADTYATLRVAPTISGNPLYRSTSSTGAQISVSPCYPAAAAGCVDTTTVLNAPAEANMRPTSLYNATTGTPKDTDTTTMNQGFNAAKVNWTLSGTTQIIDLTGAGSRTVNPGTSYHAASLVSCLECHRGEEPMGHYSRVVDAEDTSNQCQKCHYGTSSSGDFTRSLWAGGFGLTGVTGDTGASEAHNEFTKTDDNITRYEYGASNGACVACHTHVYVDITYQKPSVYTFDVEFATDGTETTNGFTAQGPMVISNSSGT